MEKEPNVLEEATEDFSHYRVLVDRAPVYVYDCPFSEIVESEKSNCKSNVYCQLDNSEGCELKNNHACSKILVVGSL